MGFLKVVTGVMGCGKSTRMISDYNSLKVKGCNIMVLKSNLDSRDAGEIKCRNMSDTLKVDYNLSPTDKVPNVEIMISKINYVMIDEAQFLTKEQVLELYKLTANTNINVVLYGLKMCWKGIPFTSMQVAISLAEKIEEIESFNSRGEKLTHQILLKDGKPMSLSESESEYFVGDVVGVADNKKENTEDAKRDLGSISFLTVTKVEFYNIYSNC